jgi:hypothetical protein
MKYRVAANSSKSCYKAINSKHDFRSYPRKKASEIISTRHKVVNSQSNKSALHHDIMERAICIAKEDRKKILKKNIKSKQLTLKSKKITECTFFSKHGFCRDGDNCMYLHKEQKRLMCRDFLNGTCINDNCQLSHIHNPVRLVCEYC